MTQEFAKTPILGKPERFSSVLSPEKTEKACILLHFVLSSYFKEETISYRLHVKEV
ncbi:MAG: hypothetical protein HS132_16525 [Planctomycetia bacterium]|nr:hypothetical protein [Planctomycetia bacterium]